MAERIIEEPADGSIVAWFRAQVPVAAHVRIDAFAEPESRERRWYNVDEARGMDEGPEDWAALCKGRPGDDGPYLLVLGGDRG
jgi:hypothetical protein